MSKAFVEKIEQIILDHIEDERFGVSKLAIELGLSRSQTLRKVKAETGKSANQLMREIRLNEALKFLKEEDLTVSEIAYKVGFSSPSYFNKCFHEQYGFTPGDYKSQTTNNELINLNQKSAKTHISRIRIVLGTVIVFAILIGIFFANKNNSALENEYSVQHASIAVLPLLDLSENKNKDYLAVGLTDAITLELSKLEGLRVISRGSAMLYKDSAKLYSEIAEKLGADLLLEGSVIYGADSLRVIVQLIEPFPHEKHVWANKYDQSTSNIMQLTDDISNQIAQEIELKVTPETSQKKVASVNPEAYELFLRGRYLWHQQNPAAVRNSIEYLNESIALDSNFAPAYSILAEAYISMNKFIRDYNEKAQNRINSRSAIEHAVDKAIELDGSLGDAYITKGNVLGKFDWDWDGMKLMAEKGLKLNPSNAYGHILLSNYYLVKGEFAKSLDEALIAERIDPLNPRTGCIVADRYFLAKDYEQSIKQYKKVLELFPGYGFAWDGIGFAQYMSGKQEDAIKSWAQLHVIMGNEEMAKYYLKFGVQKSINHWLNKASEGSELLCSNPTIIAQAYMFVDDENESMKFLERALELRNEDLPLVLQRPNLIPLHNYERYQEIVQEVGVILH